MVDEAMRQYSHTFDFISVVSRKYSNVEMYFYLMPKSLIYYGAQINSQCSILSLYIKRLVGFIPL